MTLARDWNIASPSHSCAATGKKFLDGEKLVSILRETPREWLRIDYSIEGWEKSQHTQEEIASKWHSEFRARQPRTDTLPQNDIESLLRRLIHQASPADAPARFVLAVMLERKRRLKIVDTLQRGDRRILVYEHSKTGESFLIEDPNIKLSQLEPVQARVRQLLENPNTTHHRTTHTTPPQGWRKWLRRHTTSPAPHRHTRTRLHPLRGKISRARFTLQTIH